MYSRSKVFSLKCDRGIRMWFYLWNPMVNKTKWMTLSQHPCAHYRGQKDGFDISINWVIPEKDLIDWSPDTLLRKENINFSNSIMVMWKQLQLGSDAIAEWFKFINTFSKQSYFRKITPYKTMNKYCALCQCRAPTVHYNTFHLVQIMDKITALLSLKGSFVLQ